MILCSRCDEVIPKAGPVHFIGGHALCDDCHTRIRMLRDAKEILQTVPERPVVFQGVPLAEFTPEEVRKITGLLSMFGLP